MKAFKKALNLCRILSEKKWDHEYCKMLLVDVNYDLVTVENTQVSVLSFGLIFYQYSL